LDLVRVWQPSRVTSAVSETRRFLLTTRLALGQRAKGTNHAGHPSLWRRDRSEPVWAFMGRWKDETKAMKPEPRPMKSRRELSAEIVGRRSSKRLGEDAAFHAIPG